MMRTILVLLFGVGAQLAWASKPSYSVAHPVGWMHALPVGETPGWSGRYWINFEASHANIWNNEFEMTDRRNGNIYTYGADFEQTSLVTDIGFAITPRWSFDIVAPFASRGGGALDDFIDQFHMLIGSERFLRNLNNKFSRDFTVESNSQDQFGDKNWTAVGNLVLKSKLWLWQWRGSQNGSCDCGFSVSGQAKLPLSEARSGMSSGHPDYSMLLHLGTPIGKQSGIWATAAFTALGKNDLFKDWPMRRWAQMYELSMDFAFSEHWGILLQGRVESPLMNKNDLDYNYTTSDPLAQTLYRVASGWNSLVSWRGTESFGFRWRSQGGSQINFLMIEDWWFGGQDSRGDHLYVTNAPDVQFTVQAHTHF